ncbi:lysine transporter LysE [Vitreoscilla filiformis]|uniref:Lysine transporter LysE n=1 Tax=Vitreoscilla filiformis TaxID=63 RepID=A0A221KID0_VITFI|nr:LysE family transporter [Vitreoscilla filiformis]ASM78766.1 lysine transporter LysE [Vitreoscilla filiformis]
MDALLFFPVAVAISLTPGPNNFCALNHGIRQGVGAALLGTVGRAVAFAIFLALSGLGLGAMLLASEAAFNVMKWVGAAYLFWLGWQAWRSAGSLGGALAAGPDGDTTQRFTAQELMRREFWLGISNPKAMLLFAAIFPQFIDPSRPAAMQFVTLGGTYLAAEFVSSLVYGLGGQQLRRFISSPRAAARLNRATAGVFIGAGGWLLAAQR